MARVTPFAILLGLSLQATAVPAASADSCPRGRIAAVVVNNHSIFSNTDSLSNRRVSWAYRAANALHIRTRESAIRREILFGPGDCFVVPAGFEGLWEVLEDARKFYAIFEPAAGER